MPPSHTTRLPDSWPAAAQAPWAPSREHRGLPYFWSSASRSRNSSPRGPVLVKLTVNLGLNALAKAFVQAGPRVVHKWSEIRSSLTPFHQGHPMSLTIALSSVASTVSNMHSGPIITAATNGAGAAQDSALSPGRPSAFAICLEAFLGSVRICPATPSYVSRPATCGSALLRA